MPPSPAANLLFIVKLLLRTEWNLAETERPPDAASPSNRPMTSPRARALLRTNQANTPSASLRVLARDSRLKAGNFQANHADIHTFDLANHEAAWTSNKHGPISAKVSATFAMCE